MTRKRSNIEVLMEILTLCITPQSKTRVMYGTNQSWRDCQKRLSHLQSLGLLTVHHSSIKYATTKKGQECVKKWKRVNELLRPESRD